MSKHYRSLDRLEESIEQRDYRACFFLNGGSVKLAKLIVEYLEAHNVTMVAFAERGKLNDTFVSSFKCGRAKGISVQTLFRFAKALDTTPLDLARYIFLSPVGKRMPLAQIKPESEVEVLTPAEVQKALTERGVMLAINGIQLLAEQTGDHAVPAIVEHAGWRMTLIPT